jgi:hypothetical protein
MLRACPRILLILKPTRLLAKDSRAVSASSAIFSLSR